MKDSKLREALTELIGAAEHARVFIASREKMHPVGRDLHDEAIAKARAALSQEDDSHLYLPGTWRCAKCNFTLVQKTLYALNGAVGPNDKPGEKCPNCDSPLWRVTYKQAYSELQEMFEQYVMENPRRDQPIDDAQDPSTPAKANDGDSSAVSGAGGAGSVEEARERFKMQNFGWAEGWGRPKDTPS